MQIVIDIDEEVYKDAMKGISNGLCKYSNEAIRNGIPLPKGHGRLIDADTYRKDMMDSQEFNFFKILDMQSTIVEADKESDNGTSN